MADSAAPGFLARHNLIIGSLASIVALVVAVLLGVGLMFGTETRGISAILTVLCVAGGVFTLLLLSLHAMLSASTPSEQWHREENEWRATRDLAPLTDADLEASRHARRKAALFAVVAIVVGLSLSLLPDIW